MAAPPRKAGKSELMPIERGDMNKGTVSLGKNSSEDYAVIDCSDG